MRTHPLLLPLALLLLVWLPGCDEASPGPPPDRSPPPDAAADRALPDRSSAERPPPDRGLVDRAAPDRGAPDQGPGTCPACAGDEICVQYFDGVCVSSGPSCHKVSAACKQKATNPWSPCDKACQSEYCGSGPYQCQNLVPCGTEAQGVDIYCYGP